MMLFIAATIWNSIVAWILIGICYVAGGFIFGNWGWTPEFLWVWAGVLALGYLALLEEEK